MLLKEGLMLLVKNTVKTVKNDTISIIFYCNILYNVIYSCDGKAESSEIIQNLE